MQTVLAKCRAALLVLNARILIKGVKCFYMFRGIIIITTVSASLGGEL
jgi:hypothetical protein